MTEIDVNYVYLIAHSREGTMQSPVKVGFSKYPEKRLASLQTGNPCALDFVFKFRAPSRELAIQAEAAFHGIARQHRISGEWFDMSPEFALNTLTKTFIALVSADVSDPDTLALLCEFSGVWDAVTAWNDMKEAADV